jgi:predicted metal-binding membrane protein
MLSPMMTTSSARLSGAILIAAGVYQLTPFKGACLTHCRTPLGFLMSHWRDGTAGALRMGMAHGAYCLGCCWALMCVLFVVGVMNLLWVAAIAIFVLVEKVGPAGAIVSRVAGVVLIAFGLWAFR